MDVSILRLFTDPAILHGTVHTWLLGAPCVSETAPSNGGYSVDQRALVLGLYFPNELPILVARSAFERLILVSEARFPVLDFSSLAAGSFRQ